MSPTDWALIGLTLAVLVAGLSIAAAVRQAGRQIDRTLARHGTHLGRAMAFVKGVVLDAAPAIKELKRDIPAGLTRLGIAADKIADDQPAQQQAAKYKDMSEKLILGITTVLNHEIEHPQGMKDDVIVGRDQGAQLIQELLETELINAQQ